MSSLPRMPIFVADFLADTLHLTLEAQGAYMRLLFFAWKRRWRTIPDDDEQVARVLSCTPRYWRQKIRPVLIEFFEEISVKKSGKNGETEETPALRQKKFVEVLNSAEKRVLGDDEEANGTDDGATTSLVRARAPEFAREHARTKGYKLKDPLLGNSEGDLSCACARGDEFHNLKTDNPLADCVGPPDGEGSQVRVNGTERNPLAGCTGPAPGGVDPKPVPPKPQPPPYDEGIRRRIRQQWEMKLTRYLKATAPPADVERFVLALMDASEDEAARRRLCNPVDARMRAAGWDDMRQWKRQMRMAA